MTRLSPRDRLLAVILAALAGFIDAIGFLESGGLFVSFMSGNSTRLGVGIAEAAAIALPAALVIGCFVLGVMGGSVVGRRAGRAQRPAVLALVSLLVLCASALGTWGPRPLAIGFLAAAMGAENAIFEEDGEVRIGLTYMTGALVKFGQRLSIALGGGEPWGWLPHLVLWLGLVTGAVAGAVTYPLIGFGGLWSAAAFAALIALLEGPLAGRPGPHRQAARD